MEDSLLRLDNLRLYITLMPPASPKNVNGRLRGPKGPGCCWSVHKQGERNVAPVKDVSRLKRTVMSWFLETVIILTGIKRGPASTSLGSASGSWSSSDIKIGSWEDPVSSGLEPVRSIVTVEGE